MNETTLEETGEQAFKDAIRLELGGWPLIDPNYDPNEKSLMQKLIRLRKLDIQPLFLFYLEANPKNPAQAILRVMGIYNGHFEIICKTFIHSSFVSQAGIIRNSFTMTVRT